jgi:predicted GNAT family N-acyltransferase
MRAATWIARAAPVRFGIARTTEDLEAVYRLRCQVVIAAGWASARAFPDGFERDADDARAVHVAGWDGERVVATARFVLSGDGRPLPTETDFDLALPDRARLADVGRLCVAPCHRDRGHRVFRGVLAQIWCEMRQRGYEEAAMVVTGTVARLYQRWGFGVSILGPARAYWGELRFPARVGVR